MLQWYVPMALIFKPLRCPHCQQPMDKRLLRRHQSLQAFLRRQPFACPHCAAGVVLPEHADTPVAIGLFVAVILAPMFQFWNVEPIDPRHVFGLGLALILVGQMLQKLHKANLPKPNLPKSTASGN